MFKNTINFLLQNSLQVMLGLLIIIMSISLFFIVINRETLLDSNVTITTLRSEITQRTKNRYTSDDARKDREMILEKIKKIDDKLNAELKTK